MNVFDTERGRENLCMKLDMEVSWTSRLSQESIIIAARLLELDTEGTDHPLQAPHSHELLSIC